MLASVIMPYSLKDELAKTMNKLRGCYTDMRISSRYPGVTLSCTINYREDTANQVEHQLYKLKEKISPWGGKVLVLD